MRCVESNTEIEIENATRDAFNLNKADRLNIRASISKLCTLKGVGPAIASLILSVYDAKNIVYFGDEVFRWIYYGGEQSHIGYTLKEYECLSQKCRDLIK